MGIGLLSRNADGDKPSRVEVGKIEGIDCGFRKQFWRFLK
ncbi:hypothetical protein D1BOALGB6SA_730 [Olavius sp. associated proteobacterium Delta 1]|nr:hypothetical protein D1BOALGB6SA_730 [Olavius sp. associated proteobacterium Delta 1]